MPHDIIGGSVGHNHAHDPLHSHLPPEDTAADLQVLTAEFIEGFRTARDKAAYLRIAGVPMEVPGGGGPPLKLVDVRLTTEWQVGTASPAFGTRELSWLPFPGEMITERTNLAFLYVSLDERRELDLRSLLATRLARPPAATPDHTRPHDHSHDTSPDHPHPHADTHNHPHPDAHPDGPT